MERTQCFVCCNSRIRLESDSFGTSSFIRASLRLCWAVEKPVSQLAVPSRTIYSRRTHESGVKASSLEDEVLRLAFFLFVIRPILDQHFVSLIDSKRIPSPRIASHPQSHGHSQSAPARIGLEPFALRIWVCSWLAEMGYILETN